jgi:hypothetical protein
VICRIENEWLYKMVYVWLWTKIALVRNGYLRRSTASAAAQLLDHNSLPLAVTFVILLNDQVA